MRKIFSFFIAILFASSMMAEVGSLYYTFLPYKPSSGAVSDYTKTGTMTIEGMNWTVPGNWYATGGLRLGGKALDGVDRTIIAQDPMGSAISKIRIAHAGVTSDKIVLNSVTVTTASDADFTQDVTTKTVTDFTITKNGKDTIDVVPATEPWATNSYYKIAFNFTNSVNSNYAFVLECIQFYAYAEGGGDTPVTHTYTVAGDNADLFGTAWAPTNEDNDMTLVEGLYTWEKTNQTLPAGNVAFKVCEDHAWTNCWPSDNYVLNIPAAGVYTITITYNPSDNAVNAVAQKTGSAEVLPTVAMHGNFGGQNWADTENFAVAEGNETASLTLNLAAGDYEFGMRIGGSSNWTANGAAFTRENNSAVIEAGQGNITLDADAAGEYTFIWTFATNTLTITYPEFVPPTYTYADGYYLIGLDMQDWTMEYMPTEGRLFAANPDNEGEYQLTITLAADQQFKVVSVQKDQIKAWYPDGMDNNFIVDAAHAGEKTVYFRPDGQGGEGWHYGCIYVAANEEQPEQPTGTVIYNWSNVEAEQVGTTIIGAAGVTIENVKIHTNTDNVPGIKLGNSYSYADGKWIAIKPAEGGFKAGDKVNIAICFNNSDDTKQAQVKAFAADGATELFLTAQGLNGRTAAGEPVVETFTLAADQDSILLGRYGNTATFITTLNVTRVGGDEPIETPKFYITGNAALVGQDKEWNPGAIPSMEDSKVLALEAGSYMMKITMNGTWEGENNVKGYDALTGEIPAGVTRGENENNDNICFTLAEAGDVTVTYTAETFTVAGNFYVAPAPDPTVAVMGSMNNWAEEIPFVLSDDKTYASLTVESIGADNYEFKFVINGEWRSNGYTYHRDFPGAAGISENDDQDMIFQADIEGEYTFTWFFANDSLAITYPELPFACNWDNIDFLGDGSPEQTHANQYKLCKEGEYPGVVNIQKPGFAKESGIYVTFPSAAFGEISLPEGTYAIQGAGMILYCSAFDAQQETEVTVVCDNNPIVFTIYNANYTPAPPTGNIRLVPGVWNVDGAKFAAVTWHVGEAFENGTVSAWFEYLNADTLIGNVPNDADSIAFARFNSAAEAPSMDMSMIWNHTDKLLIDKQTMIYTISGWPEEGRDFCPGYWGEYVEPVYTLTNGYYLVGKFGGVDAWSVEDLSAEKKFAANPDNEAEYQLAVNMAENDQVKVAYVENDQIIYWYPKGDNYTVDHNHAGPTTMYFRPDYFDDWNAFGGYFYIVPTSTVDITNTAIDAQAVKAIRNGQLIIIKGEKTYNAQGILVK